MNSTSITPQGIGARVREYRQRLNMTQDELADHMGVNSPEVISLIEAGGQELRARELLAVAGILQTSLQNLLSAEPVDLPDIRWCGPRPQRFEQLEARFSLRCERYSLLETWCGGCRHRRLPDLSFTSGHRPTWGELEMAAEEV
jgi:transcriptional regulator with XRE-family HTH domain